MSPRTRTSAVTLRLVRSDIKELVREGYVVTLDHVDDEDYCRSLSETATDEDRFGDDGLLIPPALAELLDGSIFPLAGKNSKRQLPPRSSPTVSPTPKTRRTFGPRSSRRGTLRISRRTSNGHRRGPAIKGTIGPPEPANLSSNSEPSWIHAKFAMHGAVVGRCNRVVHVITGEELVTSVLCWKSFHTLRRSVGVRLSGGQDQVGLPICYQRPSAGPVPPEPGSAFVRLLSGLYRAGVLLLGLAEPVTFETDRPRAHSLGQLTATATRPVRQYVCTTRPDRYGTLSGPRQLSTALGRVGERPSQRNRIPVLVPALS